jgi:hypothetical protein
MPLHAGGWPQQQPHGFDQPGRGKRLHEAGSTQRLRQAFQVPLVACHDNKADLRPSPLHLLGQRNSIHAGTEVHIGH